MMNHAHAIDADVGLGELTFLARPPRAERDVMLLVTEEPLCGALLELAHRSGYQAVACQTPLDVITTLIDIGECVAIAIVSVGATWSAGLGEFLADEYPHVERIECW